MTDIMHNKVVTAGTGQAVASVAGALVRAVTETEAHVVAHGWDRPVHVFALVCTAEVLEADPNVASLLDATTVGEARSNPELLMVVEQDGSSPAADLEYLLAQPVWLESTHGAATSIERLVLSPAAQKEVEAITDAAERLASPQERPDREDIRMMMGTLCGG